MTNQQVACQRIDKELERLREEREKPISIPSVWVHGESGASIVISPILSGERNGSFWVQGNFRI